MPARQVNPFRPGAIGRAVASGGGVGFVPVAPGTAGSLLALPAWYAAGGAVPLHLAVLAAVLVAAGLSIGAVLEEPGQEKDPAWVVIDEVAGMLVAGAGLPWGWTTVPLAFLLFRFFDIVKFGPTAWLDARGGTFAVIADDLAAGVLANLSCRGILWAAG